MNDPGDFILRFGEHAGEKIRDVPVHYLDFVLGWPALYPDTKKAIETFLATQAEYDAMDEEPKDWREGREDYTGD